MEAISRQNPTNCSGWHRDFRWPGLVELCCSGKCAGLGFSSQQTVLSNSCLAAPAWPRLVKNVSSVFRCFFYPLYLTLRHIEGVCHISSGSGLQPLDNQNLSLRVNLRHVFRGLVAVDVKVECTGVVFIHTWDLIDPLLVTGEAHMTRRQHLCLCKNWLNGLYQAVNIRILFDSFVLHWNIITKAVGIKMSHFL